MKFIRATHDSEYRKLKNETKKLLEVVGNVKKTAVHNSQRQLSDIAKLSDEIASLKECRNLLEKKLRSCACSNASKGVKSHNEKIDQITVTAKGEIQKLVS